MVFLLENKNVFPYLIKNSIGNVKEELTPILIEPKICKNFNLLVQFSDEYQLLIKQEPHDQEGRSHGDFQKEWKVYELIKNFPELNHLCQYISEAIYFDPSNSILVLNYLTNYCDLDDFYTEQKTFPTAIAAKLGMTLATFHRHTLDREDYKTFLEGKNHQDTEEIPDFGHDLKQIFPEIFGMVSADALKFYELYQRDPSLGNAIAHLKTIYKPCCLIHDDLKLDNILLNKDWKTLFSNEKSSIIRLIDWEKWSWGDPALDLGKIISSYLKIWLKSLLVNQDINIELALSLAGTPLEQLQPSLIALIQSYCAHIPQILAKFPDFLTRVMQFAGLNLIESIQTKLHYYEPFGNTGICTLQVAKTLLCNPEASIYTVFGLTSQEILDGNHQQLIDCQQLSQTEQHQRLVSSRKLSPKLSTLTDKPSAILADIVSNIQIQSDYSITHPNYQPLELPEKVGDRFQKLPHNIQENYIKYQLVDYLYSIYFTGEQESIIGAAQDLDLPKEIKNNSLRGINLEFYEQLDKNNCSQGYFDPGWSVLQNKKKGIIIVQKDELTLHIKANRHLPPGLKVPQIKDIIAIRLPHNLIESEFYVAVGNAGLVPDNLPIIEIYFNITPEGAIALMASLTEHLNAISIPFAFKVLIDPDDYGRYDAGILQIKRSHYQKIKKILKKAYQDQQKNFRGEIPIFSKSLAPGLGLAEEPETDNKDFGLNRCQLIANALLIGWKTGNESPDRRINLIKQQFTEQGIELECPYLNVNKDDIYTVLIL